MSEASSGDTLHSGDREASGDPLAAPKDETYAEGLTSSEGTGAPEPELSPASGRRSSFKNRSTASVLTGEAAPRASSRPVEARRAVGGGNVMRAVLAGGAGLLLLGIVLGVLVAQGLSKSAGPPTVPATPTVAPLPYNPLPGAPAPALTVLGAQAKLTNPLEALGLPDGRIAVADTGGHRIALLSPSGAVLQSITKGHATFKEPYALIVANNGIDVLDAATNEIDRFGNNGQFLRLVAHDAALSYGRGLAMAPDGGFYVANPASNSITVFSPQGRVDAARSLHSLLGTGPGQFNQPSAVAIAPDGSIYIVDNLNNRVEKLSASGVFQTQWPIPASSTLRSPHLLLLSDGRLLGTDGGSGVLIFAPGGTVTRLQVQQAGKPLTGATLTGISLLPRNRLLLTDSMANRLIVIALPR